MTDFEFLKSFSHRSRFSSLYLWSDAWILTALLLLDRSPIPLGAVIFAADWLNHAIPMPYEVNHALTLLSANGFLTLDANRNLLLTDQVFSFTIAAINKTPITVAASKHAMMNKLSSFISQPPFLRRNRK